MPHPLPADHSPPASPADAQRVRSDVERIVDSLGGVLWEAAWPSLDIVYVSAAAERLLGYPTAVWEAAPELLDRVIHREDRQAMAEGCASAAASDGNHRFRLRMVAAGGAEVTVQVIAHGVFEDGEPVAVRGLLLDVTAESEAEDAVAQADRRWRTLLARSPDLAMILGERGELIDATPSLMKYAGVSRAEDFHGPLLDMVHPEDRTQVIDAFGRASRAPTGTTVRLDYRTALAEGGFVWVEAVYANHLEDSSIRGIVCNVRDITARRAAEDALRAAAYTDALTGLPNRSGLQATLAEVTEVGALFLLDLDGFKEINDRHGHSTGDIVLREVACRLRQNLRQRDLVARFGGDEFVLVLADLQRPEEVAEAFAERVHDALREPIDLGGSGLRVGASIGMASHPHDGDSAQELLAAADRAMYAHKPRVR